MSQETSVKLQKSIKDNSAEVQDFLADLHRWEKDIKNEEQLGPNRENTAKNLPPVRCREPEKATNKIITANKRRKNEEPTKKERISSYDYAAWDKFDVDKALDSSSEEEEVSQQTPNTRRATSSKSMVPSLDHKERATKLKDEDKALDSSSEEEVSSQQTPNTLSATSSRSMVPSLDHKEKATKLKDEGNKCYSMGRLEDAVAKYTRGMAFDPTNAILPANRAMAYIKLEKYEVAEVDCNRCLKLDDVYIKAYLRRGTARLHLQKLKLAAADFNKVLELEPWNKDAKRELEKLKTEREKQTNHHDTEVQKNNKNSDNSIYQCVKETKSYQNETEEREIEKESMDTNSFKKKKELASDKSKKEHGKKIKIMEIDSSQSHPTAAAAEDSETVTPIDKLPHQRSQKPLKRIEVVDVPSEDFIPKQLLSSAVMKDSMIKEIPVATKSPAKASVPKKNPQQPSKITSASMPLPPKETASMPLPTKIPTSLLVPAIPRTSHQFSEDWKRLAHHQPRAVEYLKAIPPSFFRGIDLEAEVFVELVAALRWDDFIPEQCLSYLSALAQSDGFSVNVMFLDSSQKKVIYDVIEKCKDEESSHADLFEKIKKSLL